MIRFLQTPGPTKKIILGGLLLIICLAMVITLVPGGFLGDSLGIGGPSGNTLAKVGNQEITVQEVDQTAQRIARQQFQKGVPSALMPFFRQRAAEELIVRGALLSEADRMGFKVTDAELQEELQKGPFGQQLFPGGVFVGQQQYEGMIQNYFNMTVGQFEQLVKNDMLVRKLEDAVNGGATLSNSELEQEFRKRNTKIKFEYAVLSLDNVEKQLQPNEAELKAFYENNKARYANSIPEKRAARYILIDSARLASQTKVTQDDIQRYYSQHQDEYRVPEQVNVRHILVKTPPPGPEGKVDQKAVDAARAKAEDLLKQLKAGANFEELAKKNSDDPGSAKEGGSLGWVQKGRTVPEFEQAAFSLPKGGLSGVVRSTFGFHIIRVEDKQEAHQKPLAEVKAQIEPLLAQQKAVQAADALANGVQTDARAKGLDKAAADHGLQVISAGPFARIDTLPGVGNAPDLMAAIFEAKEKSPPESVKVPQGYAIYELTSITPPATPTFEAIRARVEADFKSQKASAMLAQKTQELADRAKASHDLKKAAKEEGANVKTSDLVGPDSQVPDIGSMASSASAAFGLKPGEISGPIQAGRNGVVLSILERQEPTGADYEKTKDQLRDQLLAQRRQEFFTMFAENLRQRMEKEGKIKVNKQTMERITARETT